MTTQTYDEQIIRDAIARATQAGDFEAVVRLQHQLSELPKQRAATPQQRGQSLTELSQLHRQAKQRGDADAMAKLKAAAGNLRSQPNTQAKGRTWPTFATLTPKKYQELVQYTQNLERRLRNQ